MNTINNNETTHNKNNIFIFFLQDPDTAVTIETLATVTTAYTYNVIATTKEGKEDSAIVVSLLLSKLLYDITVETKMASSFIIIINI